MAVVLLLLVLAAVIAALLLFRTFSGEISASHSHVPPPVKRALAPSRSFLSQPQVTLVTFENQSLFVRTDPKHRVISMLSTPSSASVPTAGGSPQRIAQVYAVGGTAGVIRSVRSASGLLTNHVALIAPTQVPRLVDAIGGIHVSDRAYALSIGHAVGGELYLRGPAALRYLDSAGPPGSTVRSERDRAFLEAIVNRLMDASAFSDLQHLARTFSKTVATDLSAADTVALALLRLRITSLVECGTAGGASLASAQSKLVLGRFRGGLPTRTAGTRAIPRSGCSVTSVSTAGVPAALISIGGAAVGVLPFLPAIGAFVIALDLFMLLMLLGVPRLFRDRVSDIGQVESSYPVRAYGESLGLRIRYGFSRSPLWAIAAAGLGLLIGYLVSGRF